ncbi:MAG: hypothetical protein ACP5UF_07455 [Hydrogenobaculum sp.]
MDLYFYLDTYVGEYLINFYMVSFKLLDLDSVEITDFYGSKLISNILDWDTFSTSVGNIYLLEYGDPIQRFYNMEEAIKTGYDIIFEIAKSSTNVLKPRPVVGVGYPPLFLLKKLYPDLFEDMLFRQGLDEFLDQILFT